MVRKPILKVHFSGERKNHRNAHVKKMHLHLRKGNIFFCSKESTHQVGDFPQPTQVELCEIFDLRAKTSDDSLPKTYFTFLAHFRKCLSLCNMREIQVNKGHNLLFYYLKVVSSTNPLVILKLYR